MENAPAPKRPGKARRILRGLFLTAKWLFVLLLTILLVACLIFKAPWKVNTLLTILIITPTIIPKRIRKYIYLTYAIILLSLTIWIFLPEDDEGWEPYRLDDEIAAYHAKYAVPDDQNAAVIYQELLKTYAGERFDFKTFARVLGVVDVAEPKTFYPAFWNDELRDSTLLGPWSSIDYPDMANWLNREHSQTVNALMGASQKRFCRFFEGTFEMLDLSFRNSAMKDWVDLLVLVGNNAWGDGQIDDAVTKYLAALKTAELWSEFPPNDPAIGVTLLMKLIEPLPCFIMEAPLTNEQLLQLEQALQQIQFDWQDGWPVYFDHERLQFKNSMLGYIYEVNKEGKTRLRRMPQKAVLQSLGIEKTISPRERRWVKLETVLNWFWIPHSPKKAALAFDRAFVKYEAMADPDYNWAEEEKESSWKSVRLNFDYFAESMIHPSMYRRFHGLYHYVFSSMRACRILIALKEYENRAGNFPTSLGAIRDLEASEILVDPITGDEFGYTLVDNGFKLYSKGKNGVDENGERDRDIGADDVLIWPVGD